MQGDRLGWFLTSGRLRILCYHGICEDAYASEAWMPSHFVSRRVFETHLAYLQRHAHVLSLTDAVEAISVGRIPDRAVCVTFDDGYANNITIALPLLQKYRIPATIFLATSYIESGEWFAFDRVHFVQQELSAREHRARPVFDYKRAPLDQVVSWTKPYWSAIYSEMPREKVETFRPLRPSEVKSADAELIEYGAHTHTHCILSNETTDRREAEIMRSISAVAQLTGRPVRLFAYPNGQKGDFDDSDRHLLQSAGIVGAVTGVRGLNDTRCDPLQLRRYPVGLFHDKSSFIAEITGLHSVVRWFKA